MTKQHVFLLSAAALFVSMAVQSAVAQTAIRLHGAVTPTKILTAKKEALEAKAGVKLEIVGNGSGRGLTDLLSGSADVAMVGSSLKATATVMNKQKPNSVDTTGLVEIPISKMPINFITHPGAGVTSLTAQQVKDVLSGKVKNWKDVGGADVPIKVILPFVGDGARTSIQDQALGGEEFTKEANTRNLSKEIAPVVSQLAGACSCITPNNIEGSVTTVKTEQQYFMPLVFVVKGEPSAELKKVIEEAKPLLQ